MSHRSIRLRGLYNRLDLAHGVQMVRTLIASLLIATLVAGCSDDNLLRTSRHVDASVPDSGAADSPATCATNETCTPSAPSDWTGPLAVWTGGAGDDPPACPAAFPTAELNAQAEPLGADACKCVCTDSGLGCPDTVTVNRYPAIQCGGTACAPVPMGSTCVDLSADCASIASVQLDPAITTGSCADGSVQVAAPKWNKKARGCAADQTETCEGGTCVAPASEPFSKICISKSGDEPCPSGSPYSEREVYYQGTSDTRSCATTSCSCQLDGTCGYVDLFSDTACSVPVVGASASLNASACYENAKSGHFATSNDLACIPEPISEKPTGSLTPSDPVTVCCLSP